LCRSVEKREDGPVLRGDVGIGNGEGDACPRRDRSGKMVPKGQVAGTEADRKW